MWIEPLENRHWGAVFAEVSEVVFSSTSYFGVIAGVSSNAMDRGVNSLLYGTAVPNEIKVKYYPSTV